MVHFRVVVAGVLGVLVVSGCSSTTNGTNVADAASTGVAASSVVVASAASKPGDRIYASRQNPVAARQYLNALLAGKASMPGGDVMAVRRGGESCKLLDQGMSVQDVTGEMDSRMSPGDGIKYVQAAILNLCDDLVPLWDAYRFSR